MSLAYIVAVHKNPAQFKILIESIYDSEDIFVIHVCKTAESSVYNDFRKICKPYKNIYFCKRVYSQWGTFGQVQATINAMKLLNKKNNHFSYLNFISGQDFPLKSKQSIKDFFKDKDLEYIEHNDKVYDLDSKLINEAQNEHPFNRFARYWIPTKLTKEKYFILPEKRFEGKNNLYIIKTFIKFFITNLKKQNLMQDFLSCFYHIKYNKIKMKPANFDIVIGSNWFSITHKCFEYVLSKCNDKKLINYFKTSVCSDESFFNSLIFNSDFRSRIANNNLRHINWKRELHPNNPIILTMKDYQVLKSSPMLIARKFDMYVDSEIIFRLKDDIKEK